MLDLKQSIYRFWGLLDSCPAAEDGLQSLMKKENERYREIRAYYQTDFKPLFATAGQVNSMRQNFLDSYIKRVGIDLLKLFYKVVLHKQLSRAQLLDCFKKLPCFASYTPAPLNRGLVSVTYDDGDADQYDYAYPLHNQKGIPATFYIISDLLNQPTYMTTAQIMDLHANGMEIGSHSVTHPDMTTLSQANLVNEMSQSQSTLQQTIGALVTDFAYPYGYYNQNTMAIGQQYYQSQRTSDFGFNTKDKLDLTRLKVRGVYNGVKPAQVKSWIDQAIREKTWLILLYHHIDPNTQPLPQGNLYSIKPSELDEVLTYINSSGVSVVTVDQAIKEISPQL